MRLHVIPLTVADCTSDPHPVQFDDWEEMLDAVVRVCESDLVSGVRIVRLKIGDREYESDRYDPYNMGGKRVVAKGP